MGQLCETDGLTEDQTEILKAVRAFVDEKTLPIARPSSSTPTTLKDYGPHGSKGRTK